MIRMALIACFVLAGCSGAITERAASRANLNLPGLPETGSFVPRFRALVQQDAAALQVGFIESETNGVLLLERQDGPFDYWLSPDGAHLVLESGMVHSTRGLGEGLMATELSEARALVLNRQSGWSDRFHTYLDGRDLLDKRTYRCRVENLGPQEIALSADLLVATDLMQETCKSLDQEFENLYWVARSNDAIVLSRQWTGPTLGQVSTRVVPR